MNCIKKPRHLKTSSAIAWYLDVGYHLGTLTESQARDLAGVHRTTWERWKRGQAVAPDSTLELLRLHAFGEPPGGFGSKAWQGFRFQNGVLVSPFGEFTPGDLRTFHYWKGLALRYMGEAAAQADQQPLRKDLMLCAT